MSALRLERWFAAQGFAPFAFQRDVWAAQARGQSGLLHASTGSGKTLAAFGGLAEAIAQRAEAHPREVPPLAVIWITPMRALAADTVKALQKPLAALCPQASVGLRTGDTPSAERARQDKRWPTVLVTTPESLSLMLTRPKLREELADLQAVVVDEWHELIANKRGVQVQLALARLRQIQPSLLTWAMSATLGNSEQAMQQILEQRGENASKPAILVRGNTSKALRIDALIPDQPGSYSWAGHLGARMVEPVVAELRETAASGGSALVFTNTRSQAEIWYQLILNAAPELAGTVALHHGSLDKAVREWVEAELKAGRLLAVVATSSLDLGVDFLPVERVLQIGSAKGVARLMQRAGRSGHAPGRESRATLVPTNTLELVEAAAARQAVARGQVESRQSPDKPLDVLVQHMVTVALGGGFRADDLFAEVRFCASFATLSRQEFDWALSFCERGGESLHAYPDYHRIQKGEDGTYRVSNTAAARRHRMAIGTIVSDGSLKVQYLNGATIGHMEESFLARLKRGDCFVFAGKVLEFIRLADMTAQVKRATKPKGIVPAWGGGKMPLSTEMAEAVLLLMRDAAKGIFDGPEMQAAKPMLLTQARLSALPSPDALLVEQFQSKEGQHLFVYPFAGRQANLGLASLVAYRLAREAPNTFSMSVNDYGFELLGAVAFDVAQVLSREVWTTDALLPDVLASLNSGELAQRRFREIARISGLVFQGFPGAPKSTKQVQASSSLFFEVFKKYDAGNMLLTQAEREVLSQELELSRMQAALATLRALAVKAVQLQHPSPLCLPLLAERFRETLSNEQLAQRLARMLEAGATIS